MRNKKNILMPLRYIYPACVIAFVCITLVATGGCNGGSGDSATGGTGTLSVGLTDATTDQYKAIYVTIDEVQVHKGGDEQGGFVVVGRPDATYNLLALVNGMIQQLALADLEADEYTQMRLILGDEPDGGDNILGSPHDFPNYLIDQTDAIHELKVPSGFQSGIKLVRTFTIYTGRTTELLLDFDASKSVVVAGSSGNYNLKPTIKVIDLGNSSTLMGTVTDDQTRPLEGVHISAQTYDPSTEDVKDEVLVVATTITDENGEYKIYIESGAYNLVAYKDSFSPSCRNVNLESANYTEDFILSESLTGTVSGSINLDSQEVALSFRRTAQCEGAVENQKIEVKSINAISSYQGDILPVGAYELVASTEGYDAQVYDMEVLESVQTIQDIEF